MEVVNPVVPPPNGGGGGGARGGRSGPRSTCERSGAADGDAPFRDRDVREWQHVDCASGAYERARFEADRWTRDEGTMRHQYGKLVDSLLRTDPENGLREAASRQLEVFRSRGPGGTVHVVRTRTLHACSTTNTTSSTITTSNNKNNNNNSSRSSRSSPLAPITNRDVSAAEAASSAIVAAAAAAGRFTQDFENLQLSVNPLDVTQQKSKGVVCKSASRRPPTRQRSRHHHQQQQQQPQQLICENASAPASGAAASTAPSLGSAHAAVAAANLHRVSRLCHQIHASAVRQAFGAPTPRTQTLTDSKRTDDAATADAATVEIVELESTSSDNTNTNTSLTSHTNLVRTKSSSSEDIHVPSQRSNTMNKSIEELDDLEQLHTWRRTSKIRRSLQFPKQNEQSSTSTSKPVDIPKNSVSVKKIKEDLEKGRRLNTVLRNNSMDLDALDQILQTISSSSGSDKNSVEADIETYKKHKRNSFVTVESIKEVKGRLRRTSSPTCDIYKENGGKNDEPEADDGIVIEETSSSPSLTNDIDCSNLTRGTAPSSRVKSYVYGMESLLNKKSGSIGTGSLESRVKLVNGNSTTKNEDWYNRRKSYGFEQVQTQEDSSNCISNSNKLVESSTDSGICRSSEIVSRTNNSFNGNNATLGNDPDHKVNGWKEIITGQVKKLASTYDSAVGPAAATAAAPSVWPRTTELKSTTITIPIVKNNNVVDLPWYDGDRGGGGGDGGGREIKRHSIAVDESRYVRRTEPIQHPKYRRISLVTADAASDPSTTTDHLLEDADEANAIRRIKKVEFCKTEVHFAAESGKVNIVATDEKPPPTQNFRRRRRNSGPPVPDNLGNKSGMGLPVLRFGDSSEEQSMFGVGEAASGPAANLLRRAVNGEANLGYGGHVSGSADMTQQDRKLFGIVTVNADAATDVCCCPNDTDAAPSATATATFDTIADEDRRDFLNDNEIKGILKNKPMKPKPYHLGETDGETIPIVTYPSSDEETSKWGVKLRHVEKPVETPIWKSTVTVHNFYDKTDLEKEGEEEESSSNSVANQEFQNRLRNLRPTKKVSTVSEYASDSDIKLMRSRCWNKEDDDGDDEDINQSMEHKSYSTKINFGEGEATVVENDDRRRQRQRQRQRQQEGNTTWPRLAEGPLNKDSKQLLHKGLVVRIEKEDHNVRSKITTSDSETHNTTTTKITIDLTPSPPLPERNFFSAHQRSHFKSTSLILNTIKDNTAMNQQQAGSERNIAYRDHLKPHGKPHTPNMDDLVPILVNVRNHREPQNIIRTRIKNDRKTANVERELVKVDSGTSLENHEEKFKTCRAYKNECSERTSEHPRSGGDICSSVSHRIIPESRMFEEHQERRSAPNLGLFHNTGGVCDQKTTTDINRDDVPCSARRNNTTSHREILDSPTSDRKMIESPKMIYNNIPISVDDTITNSNVVLRDDPHRRLQETIVNSHEKVNSSREFQMSNKIATNSNKRILSDAVYADSNRHDLKTKKKTERETKTVNGGWGADQNSLEVLKRLYEEANNSDSDDGSDADKEVQQLLMSTGLKKAAAASERRQKEEEQVDGSSVVSGSWSKMRAYRILWENRTKFGGSSTFGVNKEKDSTLLQQHHPPNTTNNRPVNNTVTTHNGDLSSPTRRDPSPIDQGQRNSWPPVRPNLTSVEKLSSPSLVGKTGCGGGIGVGVGSGNFNTTVIHKHATEGIVLRQPNRSEMTYFGIKVSPSPKKKVSQAVIRRDAKPCDKPDLLQHHHKSISPTRHKYNNKPRQKTPEPIYENVHSHNNYEEGSRITGQTDTGRREFDNSILDELTKAADQILEAVNGFTDEDTPSNPSPPYVKQITDQDGKIQLETIVETKSWKQTADCSFTHETKPSSNLKSRLKHTSSTSSVGSIAKKRANEKPTTMASVTKAARQQQQQQQRHLQQKKKQDKSDSSTASSKANLKARRLQRASSREALLHSHGSSSEDLPDRAEVVVRKPRLVKKTKSVQLTMTMDGLELKKPNSTGGRATTAAVARKREDRGTSKLEERILNSLPEIRHKTAVSTIRSTSEKLTKDRTKYKHEDSKKKKQKTTTTMTKRDTTTRGTTSGTAMAPATHPTNGNNVNGPVYNLPMATSPVTNKSSTAAPLASVKATPAETATTTTTVAVPKAVTQHRISTANIKKCKRSEGGVKP